MGGTHTQHAARLSTPTLSLLSGVGFLRQAREKRLSTRRYFSQPLDFIEMVFDEL